ncbi:hypothetical protein [Trichocoleus sp. FACHB-262]|uniref:hypothetical protein n=1 Tax=Trichocoleus sp. FACHB-262 TaxID=2692869 RepID=UPI0016829122|nr:hypothetical protein [Trichocoleus sp. FACHB-262]MBD2122682.1 hypothetical protein [Trichocoleus sp. FACHB-262]
MAFRKPITTLGGLMWWQNIKQDMYFLMQEHKVGLPMWPYKYRILLQENRMEIANSNDLQDIELDWEYLQVHAVPQLNQKIDLGAINPVDTMTVLAGVLKILVL